MSLFKQIEGYLDKRHFWSLPRRKKMTWLQPGRPHLQVDQWLKGLGLIEYANCFQHASGVECLLDLDEADIKVLGIKNGAHRAKIVSSLVYLQNKYEKATGYRSFRSGVSYKRESLQQSTQEKPPTENCVIKYTGSQAIKCGMEPVFDPNASPQKLRKALEWELSLDSRDLRSHAWYHGTIPRSRAEELANQDGDFLIRDCISQPGDYVLTCRSKGLPLHFVINKMIIQPNTVYERIQFLLEDDSYDTVPDLVTCYVGSGKPISSASSAKISRPINRSMPLSFYANRYGSYCRSESDFGSRTTSPLPSLGSVDSAKTSPVHSPRGTPPGSPFTQRRQVSNQLTPGPPLPEKRWHNSSSSVKSVDCRSVNDIVRQSPYPKAVSVVINDTSSISSSNDCRRSTAASSLSRRQHLIRAGSEPMLSPATERKKNLSMTTNTIKPIDIPGIIHDNQKSVNGDVPPPKPSRTASIRSSRRPYATVQNPSGNMTLPGVALAEHFNVNMAGNNNNENDSGNGSGDSMHSADILLSSANMTLGSVKRRPIGGSTSAGIDRRRRPCSDTRYSFLDRKSATSTDGTGSEADSAFGEESTLVIPYLESPSCFELSSNSPYAAAIALLLPTPENKPLEVIALRKIHSVILDCGPRIIGAHLTHVDLGVFKLFGDVDLGLGVMTGLELVTLPQGHQLRLDIIERTECLKLFVAITILTCLNETERASMLRKWIEIAIDTKTALGNLYSFVGIMLGLGIPQVQRLKMTWCALRLNCTDTAFTYETKLRPTLKSMNECSNPQAPNTTIPHVLPLIVAIEKSLADEMATTGVEPEVSSSMTMSTSTSSLTLTGHISNPMPPIRCSFPWEQSSADYGSLLLLSHLECGRNYIQQSTMYRRNSEIVLEDIHYEELLLAMFRTEFHLRFLWGHKGATVGGVERHAKFEQILAAMSERCEPS